jgi:PhzF family phenazine biosynthesis protein
MKTFIVDSFTAAAFKGNPAGVCLVTRPLSENEMLDVAQELNLSETTFVTATDDVDRYAVTPPWRPPKYYSKKTM